MRIFKKGSDGRYSGTDIERMIEEAAADQRLEGIVVTDAEIEKVRDYLHGRISKDDYMAWALKLAQNSGGCIKKV